MVKNVHEAVVVGGGPAGCSFAAELARRGVEVTVFEEHQEIGVPSHCTGHIGLKSLRGLGLYPLLNGIVENTFSAANFYSPSGADFRVQLSKPVTCAINRIKFDQFLAKKAEEAGAKVEFGKRVSSLLVNNGLVKGVKTARDRGIEEQVLAKAVVDAEGVSSVLLRQAGLQPLNPSSLVFGVEAEVENVTDMEEDTVEVYLGNGYAPGFYGWLVPRLDGSAKLGLATKTGNPKEFLNRLIRKHPVASMHFKKSKTKRMAFHAIPLGGPIPKAYCNGFLSVGDCASQVKSTTGGGVVFGITCARMAAEIAAEALKEGDVSEGRLASYQKRIDKTLGFDAGVMLRARHALDRLSDEKIDCAIKFASKVGLGDALRDVDEVDFQGRTLMKMVKKPAALASLAYLLAVTIFANA